MGLPEFGEHQLAVMLGGPDRDDFFAKAQPWLDDMSVAELVDLSQAMRIPAAPVTDGESILSCPQYADRGFFLEDQAASRFIRPGPPFRLSRTPASSPLPAPRLGAVAEGWTGERPGAGNTCDDVTLPFAGLKVLDLSTFWAGAYLTCYLGAFGAEVTKVESIQRADGHRYSGSILREGNDWYERGPLWHGTNLNKRDITLDLTSEPGRELALRLAAEADVVVENFSPRVVEHFGLDYDSLVMVNPDGSRSRSATTPTGLPRLRSSDARNWWVTNGSRRPKPAWHTTTSGTRCSPSGLSAGHRTRSSTRWRHEAYLPSDCSPPTACTRSANSTRGVTTRSSTTPSPGDIASRAGHSGFRQALGNTTAPRHRRWGSTTPGCSRD